MGNSYGDDVVAYETEYGESYGETRVHFDHRASRRESTDDNEAQALVGGEMSGVDRETDGTERSHGGDGASDAAEATMEDLFGSDQEQDDAQMAQEPTQHEESVVSNTMEDLFGDEDDEEEPQHNSTRAAARSNRRVDDDDDDDRNDEDEDDARGKTDSHLDPLDDDDDDSNEYNSQYQRDTSASPSQSQSQSSYSSSTQRPVSRSSSNIQASFLTAQGPTRRFSAQVLTTPSDGPKFKVVSLPSLIGIDARPFDAAGFDREENERLQQRAREAELKAKNGGAPLSAAQRLSSHKSKLTSLILENIIRWRTTKNADGVATRESNARLVRWSNGTTQLLIGKQSFDMAENAMNPRVNYLTCEHPSDLGHTVRKTFAPVSGLIKFQVSNLTSEHRKIKGALLEQQMPTSKIQIDFDDESTAAQSRVAEELSKVEQAKRKRQEKRSREGAFARSVDDDDGMGYHQRAPARNARAARAEDTYLESEEEARRRDDNLKRELLQRRMNQRNYAREHGGTAMLHRSSSSNSSSTAPSAALGSKRARDQSADDDFVVPDDEDDDDGGEARRMKQQRRRAEGRESAGTSAGDAAGEEDEAEEVFVLHQKKEKQRRKVLAADDDEEDE